LKGIRKLSTRGKELTMISIPVAASFVLFSSIAECIKCAGFADNELTTKVFGTVRSSDVNRKSLQTLYGQQAFAKLCRLVATCEVVDPSSWLDVFRDSVQTMQADEAMISAATNDQLEIISTHPGKLTR
jgi:hypothetical protein